jgi:two-component system chemotaxis sensor kinase CheA
MTTTDPKETFLQEAQDLLALLESALLDLEHTPDDKDLIDTAFRALHTIKGSGSMFGFDAVSGFTHHVETAFDRVRQGECAPSNELISVALRAKDHMRALLEAPETADAAEGEVILADLTAVPCRRPLGQVEPIIEIHSSSPAAPAQNGWRILMRLPRDMMANGGNPLLLLDELRGLGEADITPLTDDIPPLEEIDPGACYIGWEIILKTSQPRTAIEDVFIFVRDEMKLDIEPLDGASVQAEADTPVPAPVSEAVAAAPHAAASAEPAHPQAAEKANAPAASNHNAPAAPRQGAHHSASSIRVPAERLDELMNRVGELVIAQSRLRQIAASSTDQQVKSVAEEIERLVLELRDTTMGIRMVPIGSLFGRFRRVVHDLSRDLGKQVELTMDGEETELDKTVIEQLNDPLVHIIRNAIDHGLEDPGGREAVDKPREGHIRLAARHAGTEVLVTVADDGRGLDRERIRARAEERGLITPGEMLTDNELFQVLFQPGFSTAEKVTSMSGRGVGMDVVKRTIETLRGKIDLSSTPGWGTVVTLRLPLTLAIIDGLMVRVGNGRYVLPLETVEECVELSASEDNKSRGRSLLNIRGDMVPFLRLRELFSASTAADPYQKIVIVSSGDQKVGLVVDQVIGEHQTVIKSLSKLHADIEMFSGATILGDGAVALILDVPHLVAFGQVQEEHLKAAS